jgi:hypothetical protein
MFSARQLTALAERKRFLRERTALRRARAVIEARRVARPLHTADALLAQWRQLAPWVKTAAVPLAFWTGQKIAHRRGLLGTVLRWAPAVFSAWRKLQTSPRR